MYSTPVRGTYPNKIKMSWWDYYVGHCWMTGWQSIRGAFRIWADLMTSNYKDYALLPKDDPETECLEWFWVSLGEDECYPKEFLEYLMKMVDDIETGKEKVIPMDESFMDRIKELTEGVELDYDEQDMKTFGELVNNED
jgi:hypothetical protein